MRQLFIFSSILLFSISVAAQKKPLDHSVYDSWQSVGRKELSNDGVWVAYNINVQEGDDNLVIQATDASFKTVIPRGTDATITTDNRFVIFTIKPPFADTKQAKIKKKKAEDMPKDSLAIFDLNSKDIWKKANVKSFKTAENAAGWVAYQMEKTKDSSSNAKKPDPKIDSLKRVIDSLQNLVETSQEVQNGKRRKKNRADFSEDENMAPGDEDAPKKEGGTVLHLRNLLTGEEVVFKDVTEYYFNKNGGTLLINHSPAQKDSLSKECVILYRIDARKTDTLSRGGEDFKSFALSEDGTQAAYLAQRDSSAKALQKFYKLWYYKTGMDSAITLVDMNTRGMPAGMTVSENARPSFSKSGNRITFGTAPVQKPKDTTLIEADLVKLDIWHYKDDYLQTVQLGRVKQDLEKSYLGIYHLADNKMVQLASEGLPSVMMTGEGDGDYFVGVTDTGRRRESQWTGTTIKDIYRINTADGKAKLIRKGLNGVFYPSYVSPSGKYIGWYDYKTKNYFVHDGQEVKNITAGIKVPLYAEDHDQPSDAPPYGIMGWEDGDKALLIYDRYDIWKVDPAGNKPPENLTKNGRKNQITYRYLRTDIDEEFINSNNLSVLSVFNNTNKRAGFTYLLQNELATDVPAAIFADQPYYFGSPAKAKDAPVFIYTKESYESSPDLYSYNGEGEENRLSQINPQQQDYNWGTATLYHWKTFSGKQSSGILYKPEDFDSTKKYPVILYFYEKLSDGLFRYQAPAPTPSRLNISFFVSRGYIVFAPDIEYTIGHPAKSAYDYIVSAAKNLAGKKWVDAKNMGIQGQSWGGIQVAQLVTMTDMFKAAWSGAPVANMTSAYGGIRWERGMNRQFQYEKTQSRIGATLWEKPELYIENSPLFHLPKVKTPMVIMANDADGAVPWYQGIELFTAMVRLNKPVWLLNYNGEAHNLVQRKNRKDIQMREQQFFDWLLKGAKPARWITEGVPAVEKGREWGLE